MSTTRSGARDEMYARVRDTVKRTVITGLKYTPEIRYQYSGQDGIPGDKLWLRASVHTIDSPQTTLSSNVGKPGQRRYTSFGFLVVQFFMPRSDAATPEYAGLIADAIQAEFRTKQSPLAVVYRNIRVNELAPEDQYYRLNVVADFEYDVVNKE